MAKEHGLEMTLEQAISKFNGRALKDCFQQIEEIIGGKLPHSFEKEYREKSFAAFKTELKPVKGVREFIDSLKTSYCVASSGPLEKINLNLGPQDCLTSLKINYSVPIKSIAGNQNRTSFCLRQVKWVFQ